MSELAKPFTISIPAISQHLRVLENARPVDQTRRARRWTCTIPTEPRGDFGAGIEGHRAQRNETFDLLDAHLVTMKDGIRE